MEKQITRSDLFVYDMVHNNPGEKEYQSAYNNPTFLRERGYDGKIYELFYCAQYGLLWDGLTKKFGRGEVFPEGCEMRKWVITRKEMLKKLYQANVDQGVSVLCHMDMIVFPIALTKLYPEIFDSTGKIDIAQPMTRILIEELFDEMFSEFPQLDGIAIRYGETYTGEHYGAPYHMGNNPILRGETIKYHVMLMNYLREIVCVKHQKNVYYRTWSWTNGVGVDPFQYNPDAYLSITNLVAPHKNFYLCIKHTTYDFHRCTVFNQTLNCGEHNQIVEVQAAREYEGKGAYPNYIADGVINGFEESKWVMNCGTPHCLCDVINVENSKIKGVWTWSRGGGWGGPYINGANGINGEEKVLNGSELWCDLNAYVISQWAKDTSKSDRYYALKYAREVLEMSEKDSLIFYEICLLSARAVLFGKCCPKKDFPWVIEWTRDQNINPQLFNANIQNIINAGIEDEMLFWNKRSVGLWQEIVTLSEQITTGNAKEYIEVTCKYGYYLYSIYETMYRANIYAQKGKNVKDLVIKYDELWEEWITLRKTNDCCPTLFHKTGQKYIVGYNCRGFDDVMDWLRG